MAWLHKKKAFHPEMLKEKPAVELLREINRVLQHAIAGSINHEVPPELTRYLQNDVFVFSGFKTYNELREASLLLTDESGGIKPLDRFRRDVEKIDSTYNGNYLEAEYNFATGSAQMAAKWSHVAADGDRYDLQYRTARDNRVRRDHAALHDTTLPASDPFWDKYYPPNGWNCRCTVVQVRKGKYPRSNSEEAMRRGEVATMQISKDGSNRAEMFRFNPGKDKVVFPERHPYYNAPESVQGAIGAISDNEDNLDIISTKLDVKKGEEMTFEEANELKGNINYSKGGGYKLNCQSCVVANELRRRGFDVTAHPNLKVDGDIPYRLSYKTELAWIDPETKQTPKKQKAGGEVYVNGRFKAKPKNVLAKELAELTKDAGRYHIDFVWKGRGQVSGHIVTLERSEDGKIKIYDPQNGEERFWKELSEEIRLSRGVNVLRVDNLLVNTDIIGGIVTKL